MKFFSKTKRGFYASDIHGDDMPADALAIFDADFDALFVGQESGKIIDWSGAAPVAVDPPAPTKGEVIARLDTAIKAERDRRKNAGVLVGGKWFQTDSDSCIQFLGLKDKGRDILAAGGAMTDPINVLGQQVVWRTMDGSYAPITVQTAFDVVTAKGDLDAMAFKVCEMHRATMKAATNPATYNFSTGWPAVYQG